MLRRLLPLPVAAAAAVLIPGVASAAPAAAPAPVTVTGAEDYSASTTVLLPDGTAMHVFLGKFRSSGAAGWQGELDLWSDPVCTDSMGCTSTNGSAQLAGGQVSFGRTLDSASVRAVPVTFSTWTAAGPVQRTVAVSALFTGQGPVTRTVDSSTTCQEDGSNNCLSGRYDATRAATAVVSVGQDSGSGDATMSHDLGIDVTPRSVA